MLYRTTFALDAETVRRIRGLAARWRVSQAEAVRRAVARAAEEQAAAADPVDSLRRYHSRGGIDPQRADLFLAEVRAERDAWRSVT